MSYERLTLSWTRLSTYEECHQRVLRQDQGKQRGKVDGRVFLPGTVADRAMRAWLELPESDQRPGGMQEFVNPLLDQHTGEDAQYTIKWKGDPVQDRRNVEATVREGLERLEPILRKYVLPYEYQPELRFRTTIGVPYLDGQTVAVDLIGGMDILVKDDKEDFEIIDLKMTRNEAYVRGKTLGQLPFYGISLRAYLGLPADQPKRLTFITPLTEQQRHPVTATAEDYTVMMSRIVQYCHGVWKNEWEPTTKDVCHFCEVKHACDRFIIPNVRDAQGKARVSFSQAAAMRRQAGVQRKSRGTAGSSEAANIAGEAAAAEVDSPEGAVGAEANGLAG
jgi:PD-(D/E)XK nuclease superfamily